MVKNEKDKIVEQQLPGRNFSSGSTTLFQYIESKGQQRGSAPQGNGDEVVEEKYKDVLASAIPVDQIESVLRRKATETKVVKQSLPKAPTIKRGMLMKHTESKKKVVILVPDCDATENGRIRHEVMIVGTNRKARVPADKLEFCNDTKR